MARIASFTSSGTPTGARSTLAELMAKKKMLADQQGEIVGPRPIEHWMQGVGQLAQTFVNARQSAAAADELTAGRDQLAASMAGIDWTKGGPTPEQLQSIAALDPEAGQRIMEMSAQRALDEYKYNREIKRSDFEWGRTQTDQEADEARQAAAQAKVTGETRTYEQGNEQRINDRELEEARQVAADAAAADAAKIEAAANAKKQGFVTGDEAVKFGGDPTKTYKVSADGTTIEEVKPAEPLTPEGKLKAELNAGRITQEVYDAAIKKATSQAGVGGPQQLKVLYDQQDQYINTSSAIGQLQRAKSLLAQGIDWGNLSGLRTWGGSGGMLGEDAKALAQRTKDYNSIMNQEALAAMSQALKGATTDTEMNRFISDMNDPAMDPAIKGQKLDAMLAKAQAFNEQQGLRIKQMDPENPLPSVGARQTEGVKDEATELSEAQAAIDAGAPADLVRKRFSDKGFDPTKLRDKVQ